MPGLTDRGTMQTESCIIHAGEDTKREVTMRTQYLFDITTKNGKKFPRYHHRAYAMHGWGGPFSQNFRVDPIHDIKYHILTSALKSE
jgi:hypothetical protein